MAPEELEKGLLFVYCIPLIHILVRDDCKTQIKKYINKSYIIFF